MVWAKTLLLQTRADQSPFSSQHYNIKIVVKESIPTKTYLFKVNFKETRKSCEICLKLAIKIPERRHWRRSGVFIVNPEYISHLFLVFLWLTLNM